MPETLVAVNVSVIVRSPVISVIDCPKLNALYATISTISPL